jgi:hypothetical protein
MMTVVAIVHDTNHNYGSTFSEAVLSYFLEYLCHLKIFIKCSSFLKKNTIQGCNFVRKSGTSLEIVNV